jgi:hypothetical protein
MKLLLEGRLSAAEARAQLAKYEQEEASQELADADGMGLAAMIGAADY